MFRNFFSPSCDDLIVNNVPVHRVENFKYLGTILDSKLNVKNDLQRKPGGEFYNETSVAF